MTAIVYERLRGNLERLKLTKISTILDNYLEQANKDNISLIEALDFLIETERIDKDETSLIMRVNVAGFPYRKTLEQYDFNFQPSIDLKTINELKTARFIHNQENVVLLGPPGVGKTHLAIGIALEALKHKFSTYYINCHDLIRQLNKGHYENNLATKLKTLSKYKLLVIDEIGYLPFDKQGANLFFQLISGNFQLQFMGNFEKKLTIESALVCPSFPIEIFRLERDQIFPNQFSTSSSLIREKCLTLFVTRIHPFTKAMEAMSISATANCSPFF
ncbi:ATP-binding protein [bacterium]|nr:ATP-binding protein [bacterium]MBU0899471.1 ATP-binding protein [bacterium]MBU1152528.1 ATP-binding protein [bacterium]MBU1782812.1 ATP-binding protein [bacterium]